MAEWLARAFHKAVNGLSVGRLGANPMLRGEFA